MLNYKVAICGSVCDTDTEFKCGFDVTVENGGSVASVGRAVQEAIDNMRGKGAPAKGKPEKPAEKK